LIVFLNVIICQTTLRNRAVNQEELDQVRLGSTVIEPAFIDRYPEIPFWFTPRGDRVKVPSATVEGK
jgi:hypothetical protein